MTPPAPRFSRVFALALLSACDCGAAPRVEGPHPYVRCALPDAPDAEPLTLGSLTLRRAGRSLRLALEDPILSYAAGPGAAAALRSLPEKRVHLVLGGFARDPAEAARFLEALAARAALALLLPGGEDDAAIWSSALEEAPPTLVDLAPYRELVVPGGRFAIVPGGPAAYARGDGSCGFGSGDLDLVRPGDDDGNQWLLSWAAPRRSGAGAVDLGYGAVHAGDRDIAALFDRLGATGGVYGWPRTQAGRGASPGGEARAPGTPSRDLEVVVPLLGTPVERFDESVLPSGALELAVGPAGLEVRAFLRARVVAFARERGHSDR